MNRQSQRHRAIDIRADVHKAGMTLSRLALDAGLPEAACRVALTRPYYHAEQAIARCLGRSAAEIWPERYTTTGEPLHPPREGIPAADESTSQKREVA
ncbi:MAG: helix-turn-helix domain-containing protein [Caenispirillum sp.]|nr:helix-turn-helix domain-containing protein [Caenispirillum sp.]